MFVSSVLNNLVLNSKHPRSEKQTAVLYRQGTSLRLDVLQASSYGPIPPPKPACEAIVLEPLKMAMSAVMKVHVKLECSQLGFTAVLKLYDRRFGKTLQAGTTM